MFFFCPETIKGVTFAAFWAVGCFSIVSYALSDAGWFRPIANSVAARYVFVQPHNNWHVLNTRDTAQLRATLKCFCPNFVVAYSSAVCVCVLSWRKVQDELWRLARFSLPTFHADHSFGCTSSSSSTILGRSRSPSRSSKLLSVEDAVFKFAVAVPSPKRRALPNY